MTLSSTLSALGEGFRKAYGTTNKYTLDDMVVLMGGLQTNRILDKSKIIDVGWGHKVSFDTNPPAAKEFPFYVLTGVLSPGDYVFSCDLKGVNTSRATIMLYSFGTDGGDNTHPFYQSIDANQQLTIRLTVPAGKPYRFAMYSVGDGLAGNAKGNEEVLASNAVLLRIT